ncbi:MAG: hypothetical protein WA945_09935 [Arcobacteraceae bacterium]
MKVRALKDLHIEGKKTIPTNTIFDTTDDKKNVIISDEDAKKLIEKNIITKDLTQNTELKGAINVTK